MRSRDKDRLGLISFVLWHSVKSFAKNNGLARAASLAYYSLFALFPLMLFLFFVLSFFIASSEAAMGKATLLISEFIPRLSEVIEKEVFQLSRTRGVWGALSALTLLGASMPLVSALRRTFYDIFKLSESPPFLRTKLRDLAVILVTLSALAGLSLFGVTLKNYLSQSGIEAVYHFASYLIAACVMCLFYLAFVPARVSFVYIAVGSGATALLLSLMRPVYNIFLAYNPNYGVAFGSMKALFLSTLWIYYSFGALLFGAELIANLRRKDVLMLRRLFYEPLDDHDSALVSRFGRTYKKGEVIFEEGARGAEMFYVMAGGVGLIKKGQPLRSMKKGDYFGEMALLIETPRTTGAVSEADGTVLLRITPENFETLLREEPRIAGLFLKELARRLKATNESLF